MLKTKTFTVQISFKLMTNITESIHLDTHLTDDIYQNEGTFRLWYIKGNGMICMQINNLF